MFSLFVLSFLCVPFSPVALWACAVFFCGLWPIPVSPAVLNEMPMSRHDESYFLQALRMRCSACQLWILGLRAIIAYPAKASPASVKMALSRQNLQSLGPLVESTWAANLETWAIAT